MSRKKSKSNIAESEELIDNSPEIVELENSSPVRTSAPAQIVESVSDDARLYEIARLRDLWRTNGIAALNGIELLIRDLFDDARAHSHVKFPIIANGVEISLKDLISKIAAANPEKGALLKHHMRLNARRVGISIYVLVALKNLGEEV